MIGPDAPNITAIIMLIMFIAVAIVITAEDTAVVSTKARKAACVEAGGVPLDNRSAPSLQHFCLKKSAFIEMGTKWKTRN